MANVLTHLSTKDFGIKIMSLLPNCVGKQLLVALNDQGQFIIVYQGLTKYISTKYDGSQLLQKLRY